MKTARWVAWGTVGASLAPAAHAAADPFRQGLLALVLAVLVAALLTIVIGVLRHRRTHAEARHFHQNVALELVWTLIPFAILFALVWPAVKMILT